MFNCWGGCLQDTVFMLYFFRMPPKRLRGSTGTKKGPVSSGLPSTSFERHLGRSVNLQFGLANQISAVREFRAKQRARLLRLQKLKASKVKNTRKRRHQHVQSNTGNRKRHQHVHSNTGNSANRNKRKAKESQKSAKGRINLTHQNQTILLTATVIVTPEKLVSLTFIEEIFSTL